VPPKDPSQQQPGESVGILHVNQAILPTYNTRVKLRPVEFEEAEAEGMQFLTKMKRKTTMNMVRYLIESQLRSTLHKCIMRALRPNKPKRLRRRRTPRKETTLVNGEAQYTGFFVDWFY
jgi:hypothetical protein